MSLVVPVILCGGSGTRLWPLSRSGFPKQFLVLSGEDDSQSLFQESVVRIRSAAGSWISMGETLVVTNEEHRFLVLDQLRDLNLTNATLLLEPCARNTAPALTIAALCAAHRYKDQDPILIVAPADQTIKNHEAFCGALKECIGAVNAGSDVISILGITPTSPRLGTDISNVPAVRTKTMPISLIAL